MSILFKSLLLLSPVFMTFDQAPGTIKLKPSEEKKAVSVLENFFRKIYDDFESSDQKLSDVAKKSMNLIELFLKAKAFQFYINLDYAMPEYYVQHLLNVLITKRSEDFKRFIKQYDRPNNFLMPNFRKLLTVFVFFIENNTENPGWNVGKKYRDLKNAIFDHIHFMDSEYKKAQNNKLNPKEKEFYEILENELPLTVFYDEVRIENLKGCFEKVFFSLDKLKDYFKKGSKQRKELEDFLSGVKREFVLDICGYIDPKLKTNFAEYANSRQYDRKNENESGVRNMNVNCDESSEMLDLCDSLLNLVVE